MFLVFTHGGISQVAETQPAPITTSPEKTEPIPPEPAPPTIQGPVVAYRIDAQLFPAQRSLTATEILVWQNSSSQPVDRLQFHLYYNAFRNLQSTFMQEGEYHKMSKKTTSLMNFGEIKIKEIGFKGGSDLTNNIRYIAPDDGNTNDRTVMEVQLPTPVEPGKSVELKIAFTLSIPQIFARTGVQKDYFLIGQWFPKIGVLQNDGQWNCHQFHNLSEFFSDFGNYQVTLTIPGNFIVGASGVRIKMEKNADNTITYTFAEKNIHDFAWTAYPSFSIYTRDVRFPDSRDPVTIELLLPASKTDYKTEYLNATEFTLQYFAKTLFPYPYRKLTLVCPPTFGNHSSGMEYPTLITLSNYGRIYDLINFSTKTVFHEMAHQYWYGIIGTDESREAWLDEGITSYFEMELADRYFNDSQFHMSGILFKTDDWEFRRYAYLNLLPIDAPQKYSWDFMDSHQYFSNVYSKAALLFRSLEGLLGESRMSGFFKYFAVKYKFKHPTSDDFIETFNAYMNEDFSWAFDKYIRSESKLNHAVYKVESIPVASNPNRYRNEAIFTRTEGYFPVDISITLENGKELKIFWKENERWKKYAFEDSSPIKYAIIDPQNKIPLDTNFLDNSKARKPKTTGLKRKALSFGFLIQNIFAFLGF